MGKAGRRGGREVPRTSLLRAADPAWPRGQRGLGGVGPHGQRWPSGRGQARDSLSLTASHWPLGSVPREQAHLAAE